MNKNAKSLIRYTEYLSLLVEEMTRRMYQPKRKTDEKFKGFNHEIALTLMMLKHGGGAEFSTMKVLVNRLYNVINEAQAVVEWNTNDETFKAVMYSIFVEMGKAKDSCDHFYDGQEVVNDFFKSMEYIVNNLWQLMKFENAVDEDGGRMI